MLIGRRRHLSRIRQALDAGDPLLVPVLGEPGIGKTALLSEALQEAAASGWATHSYQLDELDLHRPLAALTATVGKSSRQVTVAGDGDQVYLLAEQVLESAERQCMIQPLLLVLDDFHWSDRWTPVVLVRLLRRVPPLPIVVLVGLRTGARAEQLCASLASVAIDRLILEPLSRTETFDLARTRLDATPDGHLAGELDRAGGNPFFVLELVGALETEGRLQRRNGVVDVLPGSMPVSVSVAVQRRLATLPPDARRVLDVGAVIGETFTLACASALADLPPATVAGAVKDAVEVGILSDEGERLRFRHALVRDSIYDAVPPSVRAVLHANAARFLEADTAAAASHLAAGAGSAVAEAVHLLTEKGWQLREPEPATSVELFERALELIGPDSPSRDRILAGLVRPLARQGRAAEGELIAKNVLDRPHDVTLDEPLNAGLALALLRQGKLEEYRQRLQPLATTPGEAGMWWRAYLANTLILSGDAAGSEHLADRGLEEAARSSSRELAAYHRTTKAFVCLARGDVAAASAATQSVLAQLPELKEEVQNVHLYAGVVHIENDDLAAARRELGTGRIRDGRRGDVSVLPIYHWAAAISHYLSGSWDDALAEVEGGRALVEEGVGGTLALHFGSAIQARIAAHRGDVATATSVIQEAEQRGLRAFGGDLVLWAKAHLVAAVAPGGDFLRLLADAWLSMSSVRFFVTWRLVAPDVTRAAVAVGDTCLADEVARAAQEGAERAPSVASAAAAAAHCRALLNSDPQLLLDAERLWASAGRPVAAASAAEDRAGALLRRGAGPGEVEAAVAVAQDAYALVGASADLARLSELTSGSRPPMPIANPLALTATELQVARLVVTGLTNREVGERLFISRHTVDSHLRHIFQKLAVKSRTELALHAAELRSAGGYPADA